MTSEHLASLHTQALNCTNLNAEPQKLCRLQLSPTELRGLLHQFP